MNDGAKPMNGAVARTLDLPAGADEVWKLLGDFNGLPKWAGGVERSELSDNGKRRTLHLKAGGTVVEDLVDYDAAARRYSYSIIESAVPIVRHRATMEIVDRGPDRSTVRWSCEFEPKPGVDVAKVNGIFGAIFDGNLKQIAALFGGQA
ncbi:MAG: SRPBCC family protein [Bradyrhizobiaceae bacterium]|nr:SRPBCC family protein [Bradyrhizobiaceae bacterium]